VVLLGGTPGAASQGPVCAEFDSFGRPKRRRKSGSGLRALPLAADIGTARVRAAIREQARRLLLKQMRIIPDTPKRAPPRPPARLRLVPDEPEQGRPTDSLCHRANHAPACRAAPFWEMLDAAERRPRVTAWERRCLAAIRDVEDQPWLSTTARGCWPGSPSGPAVSCCRRAALRPFRQTLNPPSASHFPK
jgi:hypothetical protein